VRAEVVYLNGSLVPRDQARVSVFDHGFLYGYALFETMRAYNGKIFLLERHLRRLRDSAEVIRMDSQPGENDLGRACYDTLKANKLSDARLRLTVTRGEAGPFPGSAVDVTPTVLVTATNYQPLSVQGYHRGSKAGISTLRRYSQTPLSRIKSANYLISVLAKLEAKKARLDESLLLNEHDFITEGSTSNAFFVVNSGLVTPPLESGILPGVTRGVVLELADSLQIKTDEVDIRVKDLRQFDEAFLTNSIMEIIPLVAVRDNSGKVTTIGSGKPGAITRRLMTAYWEMVARETSGVDG